MRIILKGNCRIIIWGVLYLAFIYMAYCVSVQVQEKDFIGFLYGNLFQLQKYLWDISFIFHIYLLILIKPFASPMFVTRCKYKYFVYVIGYGAKICSLYIVYTFLLFYGIPIIHGFPVIINENIILHFLNLFSFLFMLYLCYLFLLIKTNRQMLSLLTGFGINLFILMLYYMLGTIDNELSSMMEMIVTVLYPEAAVCILLLIWIVLKRKDWLLNEK